MVISKEFDAKCAGCKEPIKLFEYKGLEGGIYGSHFCPEMCEVPEDQDMFTDLKEIQE